MPYYSVLRNALNAIVNAERSGKRQVLLRPVSKVVVKFLLVMQKHGMYHLYYYFYFLCLSLFIQS